MNNFYGFHGSSPKVLEVRVPLRVVSSFSLLGDDCKSGGRFSGQGPLCSKLGSRSLDEVSPAAFI